MLGIILLGAPGVGKGTQAQFICNKFRISQISTGDMLRNAIKAGSALGLMAKAAMDNGILVSDDVVIGLVKDRLQEHDCKNGYLFDGFPRTIAQADSLKNAGVIINYVVEIEVPFSEIITRLCGRRVHVSSGRTYHIVNNPPKIANCDDVTGEELVQRDDDKEETIRKRLEVYRLQTEPLIKYYSESAGVKYIKVNGNQSVDKVKEQIITGLL